MKRIFTLIFLVSTLITSCKKGKENPKTEEPKTTLPVITATITGAAYNVVQVKGTIVSNGGTPVTEQGLCYSTSANPTVSNTKIQGAEGISININNLPMGVAHYIRYYAINKNGIAYSAELTHTPVYRLAEEYGGGYIAKLDEKNLHGLIVSAEDLGVAKFDNVTSYYYSSSAFSASDGKTNTDKILATYGYNGNAASKCRAYRGGGYSDWYLPAINQLREMYGNKAYFKNGMFSNYYYWSSTEDSYIADAWCMGFHNGTYTTYVKDLQYMARAVRDF
jgi:hypothetical protein